MILSKNHLLATAALSVSLAAGAASSARAAYYIDAGGDTVMQPEMAAEFLLVYAGQVFTYAGVDSGSSLTGFLQNDCTFGGILANCSWAPQGSSTSIDSAFSIIPLTRAQVNAYANDLGQLDGPILQFPEYALPLTIPLVNNAITANGQVALNDGQVCGIFSGKLTDWSQFAPTIPAGGFKVIYDSETGSGATWLLTQHLNAVCNASNSAFTTLPVPVTGNFTGLPIANLATNNRFIGVAGAAALQSSLLANRSSIGYLGPNYTSMAPSAEATSALVVAALYNSTQPNKSWLPTTANTITGLRNGTSGSINLNAPNTASTVTDPTLWVPQVPNATAGYPIVGYANWVYSACYAQNAPIILQYLNNPYMPTSHAMEVSRNGFVPLNSVNNAFNTAVNNTLLSNHNNFKINMQNPAACLPYFGR